MASGAAHHHMLAVLSSEVAASGRRSVRVLDAGCGNGELILHLHERMAVLHPGVEVEISGFDVSDSAVQESGYIGEALRMLRERAPGVAWHERIHVVTSRDAWPFPAESFDYVLSNHVLEHVADHDLFLSETRRVLKQAGTSIHLFPLSHNLYEGHLHMPPVHWFKEYDMLRSTILWASRLGWGSYRSARERGLETSRETYAESRADYLLFETNYLSRGAVLALAKRHRMRCSFRYTEYFYSNRLRTLLGLPPRTRLRPSRHAFLHGMLVFLLMWCSSITVLMEKKSLQVAAEPLVGGGEA
jgi:ubiquinone/menaquinone biosynthesis C-methylase UbiE